MATPTEAWKPRFRDRVVAADGRCVQVVTHLTDAQPHLALPMHTGDAAGGRTRIQLAQDALGSATTDLAFAVTVMGAACELALRGGSLDPSLPLSSIHQLRHEEVAQRNAVDKLQDARERAEKAYDAVELCLGHLAAACLLLDHPGVPGVDGFIDTERLAATAALEDATDHAQESVFLAGGARRDVSGAN